MRSKWKYNYTDEEKGMALTIQNLKQEIDKLVDTNEDINREFSRYKYESKKEIERLNKRIKELEEGFNATNEDLCEESTKIERAIKYILGNDLDNFNNINNLLNILKGSEK